MISPAQHVSKARIPGHRGVGHHALRAAPALAPAPSALESQAQPAGHYIWGRSYDLRGRLPVGQAYP